MACVLFVTAAGCSRDTSDGSDPTCRPSTAAPGAGTVEWTSCGSVTTAPSAPGCEAAAGVCIASGTCPTRVADEHSGECAFDDGPGECCIALEGAAAGNGCAELGGVCTAIAGCGMVGGWRATTPDCTDVGFECCVPQARCGSANVVCCGDTWASVASCVRGEFTCQIEGHALESLDTCLDRLP